MEKTYIHFIGICLLLLTTCVVKRINPDANFSVDLIDESVGFTIYRYVENNMPEYILHDNSDLVSYPWEINDLRVYFNLEKQTGILFINTNILNIDPQSKDFHKLWKEQGDKRPIILSGFKVRKGEIIFYSLPKEDTDSIKSKLNQFYKVREVYESERYIKNNHENGIIRNIFSETYIMQYEEKGIIRNIKDSLLLNIPMSWYTVDTNSIRKPDRRRLGFIAVNETLQKEQYLFLDSLSGNMSDEEYKSSYEFIASQYPEFRHEVDTALLALPVNIFREEYMKSNKPDCLDGKTFQLREALP